jgi:triosephosphate isomerase (TIM)
MLGDFGCKYVLVGHSERRVLYGESNDVVAQKFVHAQNHDLVPFLCVGETLHQRQAGQTNAVILGQLDAILKLSQGGDRFAKAVIAYEPVWAIGTGLTATPEEAEDVHRVIRQAVANQHPSIADSLSILYGGSVKADNAGGLFSMPNIDGALVGGASLKGDEFLKIGNEMNR